MSNSKRPRLVLAFLALIGACSGGNLTTSIGTQGQLNMNLASRPSAGPSASRASFDVTSPTPGTFTDGTNTLVLTKVQLVLRKIDLEPAGHDGGCAAGAAVVSGSVSAGDGGDSGHDSPEAGVDACEELALGPVLFDVPVVEGGAQHAVSVNVDAGTYEKVEFEIHKPGDTGDAAFLAANPAFQGVSIRVEGTWNGAAFLFTTDLDAEQEIEFSPPLTVAQSGATDLTLFVDVATWFQGSGGMLLDPASALKGQPNEGVVAENIKHSLRAFKDDNEDGVED